MSLRRWPMILAVGLLGTGGLAVLALSGGAAPDATVVTGADSDTDAACTTCDARAASKKRSREALQAKRASEE